MPNRSESQRVCKYCGVQLEPPLRSACNPCKREKTREYHRNWERNNPRPRRRDQRTTCRDCGTGLSEKEETYCNPCKRLRNKSAQERRKANNAVCKGCQGPLDGANAYRCKDCYRAYMAEWRSKDPEKSRKTSQIYARRRKYGLSADDFDRMWDSQQGRCEICNCEMEEKHERGRNNSRTVSVDHSHSTGAVRGLLCTGCNSGLGKFKDEIEVVRSALTYLLKYEEQFQT